MRKPKVRRSYRCPRWLHQNNINVPLSWEEAAANPSIFVNETMYKMRLVFMSFTGNYIDEDQVFQDHPNWANRVLLEVGKTGCSDMNAVPVSMSALCTTPVPSRPKKEGYLDGNYRWVWPNADIRLPHKTLLARDSGLEVKLSRFGNSSIDASPRLTFVARGTKEDGSHLILAGDSPPLQGDSPQIVLDSADLFNKGRQEAYIDSLSVKTQLAAVLSSEPLATRYDTLLSRIRLVVNPTYGTAWMPTDEGIPVGNAMPMNVTTDIPDVGPRVYLFPSNTMLYPEQHLSVRLYRQDTLQDASTIHSINVCLFGELEVA